MTVLAAKAWETNADLIAEVATLYYSGGPLLDTTYGLGGWWSKWQPEELVAHDIDPTKGDGVSYHNLPHDDGSFSTIAFDPPYVARSSNEGTLSEDYHERYGRKAGTSPAGIQEDIDSGLSECARVLARKGFLWVKCQDYITSGKLVPGTHNTIVTALECNLKCVDRFEHIATNPRPQPPGRRQVHARRNLSTLLVFSK